MGGGVAIGTWNLEALSQAYPNLALIGTAAFMDGRNPPVHDLFVPRLDKIYKFLITLLLNIKIYRTLIFQYVKFSTSYC